MAMSGSTPQVTGIAGIRPDVAPEIGIDREQTRLGVERPAHEVAVIAAVERGREVLAAVLDPRHCAAQMARRPDRHDVFRHERHLLAERAAHVRRHHAQIRLRHAEHVGEPGAQHVRHLHRGGERHPAGGRIEGGVRAARLQRQRALAARADLDLDDLGGTGERRGRAGVDPAFDQDVAGGLRMHERRARGERRVDIDHGILGLEVDHHLLRQILGLRGRGGDHRRDRLADVADPIRREDGLLDGDVVGPVQQWPDRPDAGKIGRREHGRPARGG